MKFLFLLSLGETHSIKGSSTGQTTCALPAWKGSLCLFVQGCDEYLYLKSITKECLCTVFVTAELILWS